MPIKMCFIVLLFIALSSDRSFAGQIATAEGIGPVKIGMTAQQAKRALGAKLDPMRIEFSKECWMTSRSDKVDPQHPIYDRG